MLFNRRSDELLVPSRYRPSMVHCRWAQLLGLANIWRTVPHHDIHHWTSRVPGTTVSAQSVGRANSVEYCRGAGCVSSWSSPGLTARGSWRRGHCDVRAVEGRCR